MNPRQVPGGRNWIRDHREMMFSILPPLACSALILIQYSSTCIRMGPQTVGWNCLHHLEIKKMSQRYVIRPILWRQFLDRYFFIPSRCRFLLSWQKVTMMSVICTSATYVIFFFPLITFYLNLVFSMLWLRCA